MTSASAASPSGSASMETRPARDAVTAALHPERQAVAPAATVRPHDPARRGDSAVSFDRVAFVVAALALAAVTVALRLWNQQSAYELFMDEIEYADVANSFALGHGPQLFDAPFFLHPPLFFWFLSWFIGHPVPHMTVGFVLGLRPVMLVFAALNSLLVVSIARRVVARPPALVVGLVYALDPFVIRFDSRVMLEAPMMCAVLSGVLCLLVAVGRPAGRERLAFLALAGLAFGFAVTTKSTSALITAVPLLLMIVTQWGLRRREASGVLVLQCSMYATYVVWVLVRGQIGFWYDQTLAGTFRAVGLVKETGFNSTSSPSFTDRVAAQVGMFGPSYLLIGVASCYAAYLLLIGFRSLRVGGREGSHARRGDGDVLGLLTCWLAGVLVAIVYTFVLAEVEEQTFYLLAVPSTVVVALLLTQAASWRPLMRTLLAVGVTLALAASGTVWWTLHSQRDDTYAQLVAFVYPTIDVQNEIALGERTAQFVLPGYGVHELTSLNDARRTASRYALVSTQLTALGLAPAKQPLLDELARRYKLVFTAHGRTAGDLRLYDLNSPVDGSPPVAPGPPR